MADELLCFFNTWISIGGFCENTRVIFKKVVTEYQTKKPRKLMTVFIVESMRFLSQQGISENEKDFSQN